MSLLTKFENKAQIAAGLIEFQVDYVPGAIESLDKYRATLESLGVVAYGTTKGKAIKAAQLQAEASLMEHLSMADSIIHAAQQKKIS
jgi:hypothetical protein